MPGGRRAGMSALASVVAIGLVVVLGAGCSSSGGSWPAWSPSAGPAADAPIEVGALVSTADGWLAVGAVHHGEDRAPAVWRSTAAAAWTPVPVAPISYYGERSLLHFVAVAPDGATMVAVGWASGGAHGNPRTATWSLLDGTLREQIALFELFGGERQIDLVGIASIRSTWVILGNRSDEAGHPGGGLWRSTDGVTFSIVDAPALASGPGETVRINGVAALPDGRGLVAIGERAPTDQATRPAAWSSTDGEHWQRDDVADLVPDDPNVSRSLALVTATPSGPVAVGIDDEGPVQRYRSAIRDASGRWRLGGTFGPTTNDELPRVGAVGSVGGRSVAMVRVRGEYRLFWADGGTEHWHPGPTPEAVPAGNDTSVVLSGQQRRAPARGQPAGRRRVVGDRGRVSRADGSAWPPLRFGRASLRLAAGASLGASDLVAPQLLSRHGARS